MPLNFNDDRPFLQSALDSAYAQAESRHAQQQEFSVSYQYQDREFQCHIWANDWADAEAKCAALRETAIVFGQVLKKIPLDEK